MFILLSSQSITGVEGLPLIIIMIQRSIITLLFVLCLSISVTCTSSSKAMHQSDTVVGNILSEPFTAVGSLLLAFVVLAH